MIVDSLIVPECVYRPGSFTGLMTIYESNFIKLSRLIAPLAAVGKQASGSRISVTPNDCDLHLEPLKREPYTTTLKLTYWFGQPGDDPVADPDLLVRIYHDARLVEAVAGREVHHHFKLQELELAHAQELGRRWRRNIMLNKWLDYLLDMGHAFP
jgi:hypothetical protein